MGDEVAFLGVGASGGVDELREFVARTGTDGFVQVADEDAEVWDRLGAEIRSSFLFVDGETGAVQRTGYGEMSEDRLRELVRELSRG